MDKILQKILELLLPLVNQDTGPLRSIMRATDAELMAGKIKPDHCPCVAIAPMPEPLTQPGPFANTRRRFFPVRLLILATSTAPDFWLSEQSDSNLYALTDRIRSLFLANKDLGLSPSDGFLFELGISDAAQDRVSFFSNQIRPAREMIVTLSRVEEWDGAQNDQFTMAIA